MVALIAAYLGCLSGCASVSKIPMQPPKLHSNVTPPSYTQMLHLEVTQMLPQITSGYTSVSKIPKQPPKILYTSHFTSIPTQWPAADKKILCPPLSARFLSNHPSYNQASNYVQRLLVAAHKTVLQLKWNFDSPDPDKILGQIIMARTEDSLLGRALAHDNRSCIVLFSREMQLRNTAEEYG